MWWKPLRGALPTLVVEVEQAGHIYLQRNTWTGSQAGRSVLHPSCHTSKHVLRMKPNAWLLSWLVNQPADQLDKETVHGPTGKATGQQARRQARRQAGRPRVEPDLPAAQGQTKHPSLESSPRAISVTRHKHMTQPINQAAKQPSNHLAESTHLAETRCPTITSID